MPRGQPNETFSESHAVLWNVRSVPDSSAIVVKEKKKIVRNYGIGLVYGVLFDDLFNSTLLLLLLSIFRDAFAMDSFSISISLSIVICV